MEDLQELLIKGVTKEVICIELDMTIHTLEGRILKDNFNETELLKLKVLNS
tara:strand:- start:534 stop:686 length:153 start_codon:yes stop_codon:yes gene_type:complete